ncbi:hypothetical protein EUGRSUZ_C02509 [Eucalyptus grandis]|uniref:Uncharacterized protein n=2 Tax=Eucalyptus grandis TaxID=71139 RepID=A0ACC3LGB3_EUCGR|nr:hypothetical protein EUGRSUZ_C02509 [Eucalyptus grandis]
MSMYIRVKRSKTTYFIQCEPTETILNVKEKLQNLTDQPATDQRLILVGTGEVLEDSKSLADQKVENDAVVALTLRKGCFLFLIFSYYINLYVLSPSILQIYDFCSAAAPFYFWLGELVKFLHPSSFFLSASVKQV